jgi:hypothetical protein
MSRDKEFVSAGWLAMPLAGSFVTTSDWLAGSLSQHLAGSQCRWLTHLSQHLAGWLIMPLAVSFVTTSNWLARNAAGCFICHNNLAGSQCRWLVHLSQHLAGSLAMPLAGSFGVTIWLARNVAIILMMIPLSMNAGLLIIDY